MALKEISGHVLEIGDKVRMNIAELANGDLDGVEVTASGKNYWRYMNEHPDEVYTVTGFDFNQDPCIYKLSGFMADNTWAADELILVPEAQNKFELIKNADVGEISELLFNAIQELCEDGMPTHEEIADWLMAKVSK